MGAEGQGRCRNKLSTNMISEVIGIYINSYGRVRERHRCRVNDESTTEPIRVTSYGKRNCADVIKLRILPWGRISWIIHVGPV